MKKELRRTVAIAVFVAAALAVMPEVTLKYPEVNSQGLPPAVIKGMKDFMDQKPEEALRLWREALIANVTDPAERANVIADFRKNAGLDTLNNVTDLRVGQILTRLETRLFAVFSEEEAATIFTTCETAIKAGTPVEVEAVEVEPASFGPGGDAIGRIRLDAIQGDFVVEGELVLGSPTDLFIEWPSTTLHFSDTTGELNGQ